MERNRQSEESHVSASPVKPISKHIKSKKAYNKSNEAWENKTDTNPIKVVFSFFVSFFPLDIVTRRSKTRQQKTSKSSKCVKQKSKKEKPASWLSFGPSVIPPQYSNMTGVEEEKEQTEQKGK